ncbi:MAG: hypothetical protein RL227_1816 [Pseudomonadota bacterium]|jgi:hypothetical protein
MQHRKPTQSVLSFSAAVLVTGLLFAPVLGHGVEGAQQLHLAQAARSTAPAAPQGVILVAHSRAADAH